VANNPSTNGDTSPIVEPLIDGVSLCRRQAVLPRLEAAPRIPG
jgi:hypothetical protein